MATSSANVLANDGDARIGDNALPLSIHPNPAYYVETDSSPYNRVRRVIDVSDGGVIGITGERGAGKSVLLNKLVEHYSKEHLTVSISAPVSASREMEFFLMLFRHVTQTVVRRLRERMRRRLDDIDKIGRAAIRKQRIQLYALMAALNLAALIFALYLSASVAHNARIAARSSDLRQFTLESSRYLDHLQQDLAHIKGLIAEEPAKSARLSQLNQKATDIKQEIDDTTASSTKRLQEMKTQLDDVKNEPAWASLFGNDKLIPWILTLILLIFALVASLGILGMGLLIRPFRSSGLSAQDRGLLLYAEDLASKLDYELTRSSERGIELATIAGLRGSAKRTHQEKARTLSVPELTSDYIDFMANVLRVFKGKILICIDELDKVSDLDQVRFILREIKGALYVKSTFYILSISNDALRSFEGRLADQRDIFESTFDDVFATRPLDIESCLRILGVRLRGTKWALSHTPEQLSTLVTIAVFSAGNARDLVRAFRDCALASGDEDLLPADEAWSLLYSRRLESIMDRVIAVPGADDVRSEFIQVLDNHLRELRTKSRQPDPGELSYPFLTIQIRADSRLQSCENDPSLTQTAAAVGHFLRYLVEIQILFFAREVKGFDLNQDGLERASMLMKAYQMLPFSWKDSARVLGRWTSPVFAQVVASHTSSANAAKPAEGPIAEPPEGALGHSAP